MKVARRPNSGMDTNVGSMRVLEDIHMDISMSPMILYTNVPELFFIFCHKPRTYYSTLSWPLSFFFFFLKVSWSLPVIEAVQNPKCMNTLRIPCPTHFLCFYNRKSDTTTSQEALHSLDFLHVYVAHLWQEYKALGKAKKSEPLVVSPHYLSLSLSSHASFVVSKIYKSPDGFSNYIKTTSISIFSQATPCCLFWEHWFATLVDGQTCSFCYINTVTDPFNFYRRADI